MPSPDFPDGKNRLYIATPLVRATRPPVFPLSLLPLFVSSPLPVAEGCVARGRVDVVIFVHLSVFLSLGIHNLGRFTFPVISMKRVLY